MSWGHDDDLLESRWIEEQEQIERYERGMGDLFVDHPVEFIEQGRIEDVPLLRAILAELDYKHRDRSSTDTLKAIHAHVEEQAIRSAAWLAERYLP